MEEKQKHNDLEKAFREYYLFLTNMAYKVLGDSSQAEDCVQDVFIKIWNKRDRLKIDKELKSYLTRSVINACYDHLSSKKMRLSKSFTQNNQNSLDTENQVRLTELQIKLELALERLPKQCRLIFSLSRFQGMSGKEIAEYLQVSKKTVDNQIGIALKKLREDLSDYISLSCFPANFVKLLSL